MTLHELVAVKPTAYWYPLNTPLRITFAQFVHPRLTKKKESLKISVFDQMSQLSNDSLRLCMESHERGKEEDDCAGNRLRTITSDQTVYNIRRFLFELVGIVSLDRNYGREVINLSFVLPGSYLNIKH